MTIPLASIHVPSPSEPIAIDLRNFEDMAEAFGKIRVILGLSNAHCDELANFGSGHTDMLLGPTHRKNLGPKSFPALCWLFGVKFQMVLDIEQAKVMAEYWEDRQRDASNVRLEPNRVSQKIIERAKPHVLRAAGRAGHAAMICKLSGEQASKFRRKGGKARMRKMTKDERKKNAHKGWEKRRKSKALTVVADAPLSLPTARR